MFDGDQDWPKISIYCGGAFFHRRYPPMVPGSQIDGCIRQPQEQRQGGFRLSIFRFRVLYIVRLRSSLA